MDGLAEEIGKLIAQAIEQDQEKKAAEYKNLMEAAAKIAAYELIPPRELTPMILSFLAYIGGTAEDFVEYAYEWAHLEPEESTDANSD